jgi:hypothetical protein
MTAAAAIALMLAPILVSVVWFVPRFYRSGLFDRPPLYDRANDESNQHRWDELVRPRFIRGAETVRKWVLAARAISCAAAALHLLLG